jgi:hypothetical protein
MKEETTITSAKGEGCLRVGFASTFRDATCPFEVTSDVNNALTTVGIVQVRCESR